MDLWIVVDASKPHAMLCRQANKYHHRKKKVRLDGRRRTI